jgi:hypothetical protein
LRELLYSQFGPTFPAKLIASFGWFAALVAENLLRPGTARASSRGALFLPAVGTGRTFYSAAGTDKKDNPNQQ